MSKCLGSMSSTSMCCVYMCWVSHMWCVLCFPLRYYFVSCAYVCVAFQVLDTNVYQFCMMLGLVPIPAHSTTVKGCTKTRRQYGASEVAGDVEWSRNMSSEIKGFEKVLNAHLNTIAATFEDVWQFVTLANVRLCLRVCVHTCVLSN